MNKVTRQYDLIPLKYGRGINCTEVFDARYSDLPDKANWCRVRKMSPDEIVAHNQKCYEVYQKANKDYSNGNDCIDRWQYISIYRSKDKLSIAGAAHLLPGARRAQAAMLAWEMAIKHLILSKKAKRKLYAKEKTARKIRRQVIWAGFRQAASEERT